MVARLYPGDAVGGVPAYTGRALRQTQAPFLAGATAARPLGATSGVRPGTPASTVTATSTTWTVTPFAGIIDLQAAAISGPYAFAFDAAVTGAVTAAGGSARVDSLSVRVNDGAEGDGTAVAPFADIVYTLSGSALPARSFVIAYINVPATGGGSPSVTWNAPYSVAAGGITPTATATTRASITQTVGLPTYQIDQGRVDISDGTAWQMLGGKLPYFQLVRDKVPTIPNNAETILESTFTWIATPVNRGGFTYSAGVVTIPISGTYMVSASIAFASSGAGQRHITVLKNGTAVGTNAVLYNEIAGSASTNGIVTCTGPLQLVAGDTLQLAVWQNSGAGLAVANFGDAHTAASSFFTIAAMSA